MTLKTAKLRRQRRSTVQMLKSDINCLNECLAHATTDDDSLSEAIDYCDTLIHRLNRLRQDLTQLERGNITENELKGPLA